MSTRDTQAPHHSSTGCLVAFDEKKLGKDVLSVGARLFDGERFVGHDGRQYAIISINEEEPDSESFIDVVVRNDEGDQVVAKYAIILQQISR